MIKSESIKELATALCKFQAEIANVKKTSDNPFFKSKYAKLEDVLNEYRPIWTKHGLAITQSPCSDENGRVGVITSIFHISGEYKISDPFYLQLTKLDPQGAGSAITYARRYSAAAELGIQQEDDDAETHRKPDLNSPLEKAKDKAVKEIKSKYKATDNWILDIDNAKSEQAVKDVVLSCKTEWERKQAPVTDKELWRRIETGWKLLNYNDIHIKRSLKKYLAVENLTDCHDIDLLDGYREHLLALYNEQKQGKSAIADIEEVE